MAFTIKRGTNISHWLSQSQRRGDERLAFFTERDVQRIAEMGGGKLDHIRLPVDEEQLWDADGEKDAEAFELLESALDWCEDAGLRAIVDLHILRTHYFLDKTDPPCLPILRKRALCAVVGGFRTTSTGARPIWWPTSC